LYQSIGIDDKKR